MRGAKVESDCQLLRTVVDRIPAMLAFWNKDQRCVFANRAYERWFGVSPEELVGKHMRELLGPLYALNLPYIEGALRGEPQEFERVIPDPRGGPPRHSLANYIPEVVDGVVQGFFVSVADVSEIKHAELALRESEERFRLTIDEAPIGLALIEADGRLVRTNRALCDILGYSAEELAALTLRAITHPTDLDADLDIARALATGTLPRYRSTRRLVRKDGSLIDVMVSASALRRADGTLVHYIAQIEDISGAKRAEAEQRFLARIGSVLATSLDHEETLRSIAELAVEDIADMCIVESVEDTDNVVRVKVAARDPAKAWIADELAKIPLDRTRPHLVHAVLHTRRPFVLDHPSEATIRGLAQTDAHARALIAADIQSLIAVPLLAGEQLLGVVALIGSTPNCARGPADLRLAEELARRAALSIRSARLYRAAQRATQLRDDVLGIVAHDLRNPLSNIVLNASTLQEARNDPQRCARAAAAIERSTRRMERLIQDLLDIARQEAGVLSVHARPLQVEPVITDAVEAQRLLARAAGLDLRLELPQALPSVSADPDRLFQIFENLIGNALKFTPSGGHITVRAESQPRDVAFQVIDSGCGVEPDQLSHVFDRFWQGDRSARHGAGLGLPIVKGLVEAHGGQIRVDNVPSGGTRFEFTIPIASPG